jgi:hypothetical protein
MLAMALIGQVRRSYKAVTQNHGMGCAVACVASVLGVSYASALKLFDKPESAWGGGYYCHEIVTALARGGLSYSYRKVESRLDPALKVGGAIVFTAPSKLYPGGHYLVRLARGWMNPWVNCPEIAPAKSARVSRLPADPTYVVFPLNT